MFNYISMDRKNICSGSIWESTMGYSRLIKHGQYAFISGTTSIDENGIVVGSGNSYLQTKHIIQIIEKSLKKISANLTDVVRTRIYVTNIEEWKSIGRAHAESFRDIQPATTMVEVARLIRPEMRVEMEADAILK